MSSLVGPISCCSGVSLAHLIGFGVHLAGTRLSENWGASPLEGEERPIPTYTLRYDVESVLGKKQHSQSVLRNVRARDGKYETVLSQVRLLPRRQKSLETRPLCLDLISVGSYLSNRRK